MTEAHLERLERLLEERSQKLALLGDLAWAVAKIKAGEALTEALEHFSNKHSPLSRNVCAALAAWRAAGEEGKQE
jgi:hypothetical protein